MTSDAITDRVREVIAKELGRSTADVKLTSSFAEDLGADSLEIVELVMAMERAFGVSIPDVEAERIRTVHDAVDYIRARLT